MVFPEKGGGGGGVSLRKGGGGGGPTLEETVKMISSTDSMCQNHVQKQSPGSLFKNMAKCTKNHCVKVCFLIKL